MTSWTSGTTQITFPIKYTSVPVVQSNAQYNAYSAAAERHPWDVTTTGFMQYSNLATSWVSIGYQQWENAQAASNNFPIAFPSTCYAVIPTEYVTWNIEGNTSLFGNISRTGFTCYNLDRRKYYVAVGI